ncbi:probable serine/threonine-protein kinase At1g54610 [Typha angustifolia]|uniref:probable serine/threonine-protein kinase At1g54610 n=1 Tax=Typha angustifolia TaxID=59011 RepID=UPI003C2F0068
MGCVSSKATSGDEHGQIKPSRGSSNSLRRLVSSSKRREEEEEVVVVDSGARIISDGSTARLIPKLEENVANTPPLLSQDDGEKEVVVVVDRNRRKSAGHQRRATMDDGANGADPNSRIVVRNEEANIRISDVPNGIEGEHVAAGWPRWLTEVAGEAVRGWLPRKAESFEKIDKIGQGTYSNVYKARDLETGKIVALKKVRFANVDPESVRFMAREIHILRRLDHPNIVKLEGLVTSRVSSSLCLVFEYMEHDLAGLAATPGIKFTEPQVKCYMQQLLCGLEHCHNRGVLHRDIKGANLLIDNNGILKIADFGLATFFNPNQKQQLTSRVVTLWYRPPELLLGATDYSASVDLWSTGCILAELLAGRPIMPGRTEVEQLHKIFKLCGSPSEEFWTNLKLSCATIFKPQHPYQRCVGEAFKDFPPSALALLDCLLAVEPVARGTAASALQSEFFTTKPFACDPSSLPKYPPSKEYNAKLRDEEARRQRAAAVKGQESESGRRKPLPVSDAELQKRLVHENPKSRSYKYIPQEDGGSGFPVDPLGKTAENGFPHRVPLVYPGRSSTSFGRPNGPEQKTYRSYMPQGGVAGLSNFSGPLGARSNAERFDNLRVNSKHPYLPEDRSGSSYNQAGVADTSDKQEWTHHLLDRPSSSHKKDDGVGRKEPIVANGTKKNRIHYSGPLIPPGGNMDDMLKEHERQIQHAVRRARFDKAKAKHYGERSEALLYASRNGRSDR